MDNNIKTRKQMVQVIMAFAKSWKYYSYACIVFGLLTIIGALNGFVEISKWFCFIGVIGVFAGLIHGLCNSIKTYVRFLKEY